MSFGEGAGFVVLESLERAQARDAKIYGEFLGYGLTGDAHHVTSPHPAGEGLKRAMSRCLERARLHPSEIDYINAHGTGTRDNDTAETQAVMALYGSDRIDQQESTVEPAPRSPLQSLYLANGSPNPSGTHVPCFEASNHSPSAGGGSIHRG